MRLIVNAVDWKKAGLGQRLRWRWFAFRRHARVLVSKNAPRGHVYLANLTQIWTEPIRVTWTRPEPYPYAPMAAELRLLEQKLQGSLVNLSDS